MTLIKPTEKKTRPQTLRIYLKRDDRKSRNCNSSEFKFHFVLKCPIYKNNEK